jgi:hypothetical protein
MKKISVLILVIFSFSPVKSQNVVAFARTDDKWGIIDSSGKWITDKIFDYWSNPVLRVFPPNMKASIICKPSEGFFRYKINNHWGFLNAKGETVFGQEYSYASDFNKGYAIVKTGNNYTLINNQGEKMFAPINYKIVAYSNKIIVATLNEIKFYLFDYSGKRISPKAYNDFQVLKNNDLWAKKGLKWRRIDITGAWLEPAYKKLVWSDEGYHCFRKWFKWGIIDDNSRILVAPTYKKVSSVSEGMLAVFSRKGWGYVDTLGNLLNPPIYEIAEDFHNGLATIGKAYNLGAINKEGKTIVPQRFDKVEPYNGGGLIRVKKGLKWGAYDTTGTVIIEPSLFRLENVCNGLARYRKDGLWGYLNAKGETVIEPQFEYAMDFKHGIARVKIGYHWGYINKTGNLIIPAELKGAEEFMLVGK